MPEMHFRVRWPDASVSDCYSPSLVIKDFLVVGERYPLNTFVAKTQEALAIASERVRAKYGFACSAAADQMASIKATAGRFANTPNPVVTVEAFSPFATPAAASLPNTFYPVVVIGGGQAGLSISYCLKQAGIEHLVIERERVGFAWRDQRWDTFCLVTPNWQCTLPGFPYDGDDPDGFMKKDEIVDYLERYKAFFAPPVLEGVNVTSLSAQAEGHYVLQTSRGTINAAQVVVATGGYLKPVVPAMAAALPDSIRQVHSVDYRRPEDLPPGAVMVVGTGQSGCQLAEDLHLAGRKVYLCVGEAPRVARRYRGKDVVAWLDMMGYYDLPVDKHPLGEGVREKTNHYVTGRDGGHDIDLRAFALEGMGLHGRLMNIENGVAHFDTRLEEYLDGADKVSESIKDGIDKFIESAQISAPTEPRYTPVWRPESVHTTLDLAASGITSIIWCIGFKSDYAWMDVPIFDAKGYPRHDRGVTPSAGLYFLGLPWQYSWGSGRFSGVARDAAYLLEAIQTHAAGAVAAPTPMPLNLSATAV